MKYVNFCFFAMVSLILMSSSVKTDKISIGYYPGERIPNIVFDDASGNRFDLSSYKGKKVVINFWAAYDASSRAKNVLMSNYLKTENQEIALLSVSFDENRAVFQQTLFWDKIDQNSQFCDVKGTESKLFKEFKLDKGFKNYLIDENGVILAMNVSPETLKTLL